MQLTRCPVCHCRINLEALIQDDAGRELLTIFVKLDKVAAAAIVGYIGLFRSSNRDLANDRALRLCNEVLDMGELAPLSLALNHKKKNEMRKKEMFYVLQSQLKKLEVKNDNIKYTCCYKNFEKVWITKKYQ